MLGVSTIAESRLAGKDSAVRANTRVSFLTALSFFLSLKFRIIKMPSVVALRLFLYVPLQGFGEVCARLVG